MVSLSVSSHLSSCAFADNFFFPITSFVLLSAVWFFALSFFYCFFSELFPKALLLPRVMFSALFLTLFVKFHKFRRQSGLTEVQCPVVVQIFDYIPKFSLFYPNHLCKTVHSAACLLTQLLPDCPWYLLAF